MDYFLNILLTSGVTSLILVVIVFLFREKIIYQIQYSTKYKFDKELENYKEEEIKRKKAALMAELISEWISFPKDTKRLNQLTLEAFIWLPKDIAIKLNQRLINREDAPDVRELVSDVRKIILGENEVIESNKIILFPTKRENSESNTNT